MKLSVRKLVAGCVQVRVCQRSRSWQLYVFNISVLHHALELGSLSGGGGRISSCKGSWGHVSMVCFSILTPEIRNGHPEGPSDPGSCLWLRLQVGYKQKRKDAEQACRIFPSTPHPSRTSWTRRNESFFNDPSVCGFFTFFFLWNSPLNLCYLSITYPVAVPQLNSRLHLNH